MVYKMIQVATLCCHS